MEIDISADEVGVSQDQRRDKPDILEGPLTGHSSSGHLGVVEKIHNTSLRKHGISHLIDLREDCAIQKRQLKKTTSAHILYERGSDGAHEKQENMLEFVL